MVNVTNPWSSARPGVSNPWRTITRFDIVFPAADQLDLPSGFEPGVIFRGGWRVDPPDPDPCLGVDCRSLKNEVAIAADAKAAAKDAAAAATLYKLYACYWFTTRDGDMRECDKAIAAEKAAKGAAASAEAAYEELKEKYKKCCSW